MRLVLSLLLVSAWSALAMAQGVRVEIRDPGIYEAVERGRERVPSLATGDLTYVENAQLAEHTTTITARAGLRFGYTYQVEGAPPGSEATLRFVALFPAPGLRDPKSGRTMMTEEVTAAKVVGEPHVDLYTFEHDWEFVPGVWTFQIWYEGRKLAEQSFTVVVP